MNQTDEKLVLQAVNNLAEHFDCVRVFVSQHDGPTDVTQVLTKGIGNCCGQQGQIRQWLEKLLQDARTQAKGRISPATPTNKAATKLVQHALNKLTEHFDCVRIFVSRHDIAADTTQALTKGSGNLCSQFGQVCSWMETIQQDAREFAKRKE